MTAITPARSRIVLADLLPGSLVRDAILVLAGAGLTGLAAQVVIHTPLTPVPFTLQTLSVLVVSTALGALRGVLSMALYLVLGVVGVPWFAGHASGFGGPTFGYVIGFVAAAAVAGMLAERGEDRRIVSTVGLMSLSSVVIYAIGATWLAVDLHLTVAKAIELGVTPFLVTDALKVAVATLVFPTAWRFVRR